MKTIVIEGREYDVEAIKAAVKPVHKWYDDAIEAGAVLRDTEEDTLYVAVRTDTTIFLVNADTFQMWDSPVKWGASYAEAIGDEFLSSFELDEERTEYLQKNRRLRG